MTVTRRNFLLTSGAAVLGVLSFSGVRAEPEDIVVAVLKRRVGYLNVDPAVFKVFARDYLAWKAKDAKRLRILATFALPLRLFSPYELLPQGNALRRLENDVVGRFLLSTDFFRNGADESKPVVYLGYFDPLTRPCSNPLMQFTATS